ncbi:MAG: cytidine/deoxycytidylate deaminase family protein [candidate division WOR-3 bacterium]|nr:MAG: cytidine/deoxycytidylate deaminase family protein [candidate division WOR-3 bacterium]
MTRKSWDDYFMSIADLVAERSTCMRRHVGALIVKDKRIVATGYNGAPSGISHCSKAGCLREQLKIPAGERHEICRGIHAEQNAIIQAATFGANISGGIIYTTHQPCFICTKMLINAHLTKIIYREEYPDDLAIKMLEEANIPFVKL